MKIEIDYQEGMPTRCLITEYKGHPDKFVDFFKADKFSQLLAMNAFKEIIDKWGESDECIKAPCSNYERRDGQQGYFSIHEMPKSKTIKNKSI